MKKFKQFNKAQIALHLSSQEDSGLTVADYCTKHSLIQQTFYTWKFRYKSKIKGIEPSSDFVAINVAPPIYDDNRIIAKLAHPNGCSISFYSGCTSEFLSQTINQL